VIGEARGRRHRAVICRRFVLTIAAASAVAACANTPPPEGRSEPAAAASSVAAVVTAAPSASASAAAADAGSVDAGPADDAGPGAASADAGAAAAPFDPLNRELPPRDSEELQARARALFEAIVKNDPGPAEPFWFPKEPFIPLKDVKGPDKYWDQLHRAYENDVRALHRKRTSWEGATFDHFELGSTPKWVKPGEEANKIGYHRSFRGKLHYQVDGKPADLDVHVVISWQGRWYITHLSKFKK
jgi:hypothetical protein